MVKPIAENKVRRLGRNIYAAHLNGKRKSMRLLRGLQRLITRMAGQVC